MNLLINLPLTLYTLYLFINLYSIVNASKRPWTAAENSGPGTRRARAVNRPTPINCRLGSWSSWTPCNSCTDKKFRFRYLERPSQFGGTECIETLWDSMACPTATGQCLVPDYCGESFTCKETGRCISQSLRCNGEPDCDDSSDEDDCESYNQRDDKCSTLFPIPGAERGTQGYNILTGEFVDPVLDSKYFGGKCEYVYNGEWRKFVYDSFCENLHYSDEEKNYRKPHNYHTYRFVAEAMSKGSQEYFDDVVSLLNARKEMWSANGAGSIGIWFVELERGASMESEFLSNIMQRKSQDLGFVRLFSKVQTALFKMRNDKLMLHEDFYISLMELPEQYDFGMYSCFFNKFGTHYVTEGVMGGTLEYVVVVNKTSLSKSKTEAKQHGDCSLGMSLSLGLPFNEAVLPTLKLSTKECSKTRNLNNETDSTSDGIEDIITLVKGGLVDSSSGLLAIRNPDTYRKWGATLKQNPRLIEYETMPIYELVRLSTAADHVGARLSNLQRAWDEYLQQFDSCRCAPCRHNGVAVLMGTSCKCICKSGFQGDACEETLRGDIKTDGSWSCWGVWSSCAAGRRTRSRTCNNPAPDGGGASCRGSSSQTRHC